MYSASIVDILDYTSTTKLKTLRSFGGYDINTLTDANAGTAIIGSMGGLWSGTYATTAINRIDIACGTGNLDTGSTVSLYGIRGA